MTDVTPDAGVTPPVAPAAPKGPKMKHLADPRPDTKDFSGRLEALEKYLSSVDPGWFEKVYPGRDVPVPDEG